MFKRTSCGLRHWSMPAEPKESLANPTAQPTASPHVRKWCESAHPPCQPLGMGKDPRPQRDPMRFVVPVQKLRLHSSHDHTSRTLTLACFAFEAQVEHR